MSTKAQLALACLIAVIVIMVVAQKPAVRHAPSAAAEQPNANVALPQATGQPNTGVAVPPVSVQPNSGVAAITVERQGDIMQLALAFRGPHGESTPPRMSSAPTFTIVDTTGNTVHSGHFDFG